MRKSAPQLRLGRLGKGLRPSVAGGKSPKISLSYLKLISCNSQCDEKSHSGILIEINGWEGYIRRQSHCSMGKTRHCSWTSRQLSCADCFPDVSLRDDASFLFHQRKNTHNAMDGNTENVMLCCCLHHYDSQTAGTGEQFYDPNTFK